VFDFLLLPEYAPFVVSFGMMLVLGVFELVSLLVGLSLTEHLGAALSTHFGLDHADGAHPGITGSCLSWLHVGRVPLLVILTLFLLGFSLAGVSLQCAAHVLVGSSLNMTIAIAMAVLASLLFTRHAGALIARFIPAVQSRALSENEFIGAVASMVGATASKGVPGQARFIDRFGQKHYLRVEPMKDDDRLSDGMRIVIVERASDSLFRAVAL
jgi:hypothetical protein